MKTLLLVFAFAGLITSAVSAAVAERRRVALVFDDGPHLEQGAKLHAIFAQAGIPVSFAQVGQNVTTFPAVTKAAAAAGHEIVNHSLTHARIAELDAAGVAREVHDAQKAITVTLGQKPKWYWPPFLALDQRLLMQIEAAGLSLYRPHHLVDSKDWDAANIDAAELARRATTGVRDGSVILFHEWRVETAEQMPAILAELRRQGCEFYTFSELATELEQRPPSSPPDLQTQGQFSVRRAQP